MRIAKSRSPVRLPASAIFTQYVAASSCWLYWALSDGVTVTVLEGVQSVASLFRDPTISVTGTDAGCFGEPLTVKLASVTVVVAC